MATQQVRNIINNQIDSVINRAEKEIRNEGKKKVDELKRKIPTMQSVQARMMTETNTETCSDRGYEEFMKKYNNLNEKLQNTEHILDRGLGKINAVREKIKPITEEMCTLWDFILKQHKCSPRIFKSYNGNTTICNIFSPYTFISKFRTYIKWSSYRSNSR